MDDARKVAERLNPLEGADAGALGLTPPPEPAPPGAQEPVDEALIPGSTFGDRVPEESKPWFTSLAAGSGQGGVANDPAEAQEPDFADPDDQGD